jgi:hypothetical protein
MLSWSGSVAWSIETSREPGGATSGTTRKRGRAAGRFFFRIGRLEKLAAAPIFLVVVIPARPAGIAVSVPSQPSCAGAL